MERQQVKLLYGHYGWSAAKIADFLGLAKSVVQMYVEEIKQDFAPAPTTAPTELLPFVDQPEPAEPAEPVDQAYSINLQALKSGEVHKQLELAPLIATIELRLFHQVAEAAKIYGTDPAALAQIVDTFKKLTRDSIIHTVVKEDNKDKNAPQVAVQILQFRD